MNHIDDENDDYNKDEHDNIAHNQDGISNMSVLIMIIGKL